MLSSLDREGFVSMKFNFIVTRKDMYRFMYSASLICYHPSIKTLVNTPQILVNTFSKVATFINKKSKPLMARN